MTPPGISRVARFLQISLAMYTSIAVLYTTHHFALSPAYSILSSLLTGSPHETSPSPWLSLFSDPFTAPARYNQPANAVASFTSRQELQFLNISNEIIYWTPSQLVEKYSVVENAAVLPITMTEDSFLSKAFSQSMRPSKIVPFFYRATGGFDKDDITITTLITSNRFKVFAQLVENYEGPISVTIHVKANPTSIEALFASLHALYTSTPSMSKYVDVHLVIDSFDRQFNTWRNIARLFARTDYVMMLDVDFAICTDFRRGVRESADVMRKLGEGNSVFVVPAFEYVRFKDGMDQKTFPKDKQSLLALVKSHRIGMFHRSWAPGHNSTNYERLYASPPGEVYKVTQYQSAYEPYVIFKKDGPPWCDERFVGYGGNKAACLFEMYLSGLSFYVLADHFLVHQNHLYEEAARKQERKYNRRIYADFKEEACLRYIKRHYDDGTLDTPKGHNVQQECMKVRGVSRIAAHLIEGSL